MTRPAAGHRAEAGTLLYRAPRNLRARVPKLLVAVLLMLGAVALAWNGLNDPDPEAANRQDPSNIYYAVPLFAAVLLIHEIRRLLVPAEIRGDGKVLRWRTWVDRRSTRDENPTGQRPVTRLHQMFGRLVRGEINWNDILSIDSLALDIEIDTKHRQTSGGARATLGDMVGAGLLILFLIGAGPLYGAAPYLLLPAAVIILATTAVLGVRAGVRRRGRPATPTAQPSQTRRAHTVTITVRRGVQPAGLIAVETPLSESGHPAGGSGNPARPAGGDVYRIPFEPGSSTGYGISAVELAGILQREHWEHTRRR